MKIVYNTILFTLLFLATSCDHSEKIDDIKLEISQNQLIGAYQTNIKEKETIYLL